MVVSLNGVKVVIKCLAESLFLTGLTSLFTNFMTLPRKKLLLWRERVKIYFEKEQRVMNDLKGIKEILKKHKEKILREYKVKEIGIFGSFVRGEQKRRSDIDILVDYSELPDIFLLIDLEDYLRKILKKKVDLVRKGAIRPELKEIISKEVVYI